MSEAAGDAPAGSRTFELAEGVRVPRLIVGLWQLSAGHRPGPLDLEATLDALERTVDAGLGTFDCADIYTGVEEILGRLIRRLGPGSGVRVHTKFVPDREALAQLDRRYVERIIDRSLQRLGVEALELVQFSWWDYSVPGYVETLGWLGQLQTAGKIRHLGTTNFDVPRLQQLATTGVPMVSHQVQYSLLDRRPEHGLVDWCRQQPSWLLCYGSLAGGFLGERWLRRVEPDRPWPNRSLEKYRLILEDFGGWDAYQSLLQVLESIARKHGVGIANVAARWVLERPCVGAVIVGMRDASHLDDNLNTLALCLDTEDRRTIDQVLREHPGPSGDVFGLERIPEGPHARLMRYNLNRDADGLG